MYCRLPDTISKEYRGTLISRILEMEKRVPISFAEAIERVNAKWFEELWTKRTGCDQWYLENFVAWISSQGFHIELTGDEFEAAILGDKFA